MNSINPEWFKKNQVQGHNGKANAYWLKTTISFIVITILTICIKYTSYLEELNYQRYDIAFVILYALIFLVKIFFIWNSHQYVKKESTIKPFWGLGLFCIFLTEFFYFYLIYRRYYLKNISPEAKVEPINEKKFYSYKKFNFYILFTITIFAIDFISRNSIDEEINFLFFLTVIIPIFVRAFLHFINNLLQLKWILIIWIFFVFNLWLYKYELFRHNNESSWFYLLLIFMPLIMYIIKKDLNEKNSK